MKRVEKTRVKETREREREKAYYISRRLCRQHDEDSKLPPKGEENDKSKAFIIRGSSFQRNRALQSVSHRGFKFLFYFKFFLHLVPPIFLGGSCLFFLLTFLLVALTDTHTRALERP